MRVLKNRIKISGLNNPVRFDYQTCDIILSKIFNTDSRNVSLKRGYKSSFIPADYVRVLLTLDHRNGRQHWEIVDSFVTRYRQCLGAHYPL